ncbi:RelA/SpoT family protein [Laribacter hongkongensis]|uniref:RelA/SpoT family protein n=1 Tax=Laribacter hongkongensis TaxID=168471 RepID=UPI001EFC55C0|nr:bifunctional (p)ppGpp synthetase/guanosine-3',5'-bis(diphosphate) 3'-pyrophosphohydrolase [Laribacter hongkongensis]MCG9076750.1 bifunctional (p)ppGpp synthetase/guanosine-3',5'-bis(diphosphate) 3'-pyrophosphohydrolase [Laribacter hongkongensis]
MVSVARPLADSLADAADPNAWLAGARAGLPAEDLAQLERAFSLAREQYAGRKLGHTDEEMFSHAVHAAAIIADLNLPSVTTAATLLAGLPLCRDDAHAWLTEKMGKEVADLVEGVARLGRIAEFAGQSDAVTPEARAQQAEAMRKMLLAMVADIRIVLIKLAWRTQTMHWLAKVPDEQVRRRIARETQEIFAPLANRLGVWQIKWELEDLAFRHLEPDNYKKIAKLLDERRVERLQFIEDVLSTLRSELAQAGVRADVAGRAKHIYSIWKKMRKKHLDFSELYDIRAVRVLVDKVSDCYAVLGMVHSLWQPIPGEFDDYIAHPKANDYKSLHTAVIGPQDKVLEVQIRTFDMHEHAEFGVAAHWRYKEGGRGDGEYEEKIAWLRQLLDWREEVSDRQGLASAFQTALFSDTIYVLTPQGRVVSLPQGATPIDFAYALHSDLGHRCRGAKIDGTIVPLSTPLENGQRIEIMTVKEGGPSINWLHEGWVKSHRAITKIRQYIRQQNAHVAIDAGRVAFEKELAKLPPGQQPNLEQVAEKLGHVRIEDMYAAIGHGEMGMRAVHHALLALLPPEPAPELEPEDIVHKSRAGHDASGILIEGVDNLMTVLAKCCKPAPPDPVVGFVTRGRGVSIHRANCVTLKRLSAEAPERLISVDWGLQEGSVFAIDIEVMARDRSGLLRDISDVLSREKLNVTAVHTQSRDAHARMCFTIEVRQVADIQRVLARVGDVNGVQEVRRI